jgi:ketosteroid isomerase-like protein
MSQENVELARRAIEAYNLADFDAMRAMNHPDVKVDWSASRGLEAAVYQGNDEVLGFYRTFFDTFEEVVIEPYRCIEAGDSVIVPNSAHMLGRDGVEISAKGTLVFKVQGGLIAEVRLYQTLAGALEAAGPSE